MPGQPQRSGPPDGPHDAATATCLAAGWTLVALSLAGGLLLESFHLVKLPLYLDIRLRRELWTLAHAHGTLLGAVAVLVGLSAGRLIPDATTRARAARLVTWGAVLVPLGFLGGGIANAEGDPSLAIVLVPAGGLLALAGLALLSRGAWKDR
jgi:hypothetical protein